MKVIIYDHELENPGQLNELYTDILARVPGGSGTGKYEDVTGTRIEIDDLAPSQVYDVARQARLYLKY